MDIKINELDIFPVASKMLHDTMCKCGLVEKRVDDPVPFEQNIVKPLVRAFSARVGTNLGPAIEKLVDKGVDLTSSGPRFNREAIRVFHNTLRRILGTELAVEVQDDVLDAISNMYTVAEQLTSRQVGRISSLTAVDQELITALNNTTHSYLDSSYSRIWEPELDYIMNETLEEGFGAVDLSDRLEERMSARLLNRSPAYWDVVANQSVNSSRSMAQLNTYRKAEVTRYEIVAVMDGVTTPICQYLDGQVFRTEPAFKHMENLVGMGKPTTDDEYEEQQDMRPWVGIDTGRALRGLSALFTSKGGERSFLPHSTLTRRGSGRFSPNDRPRVPDRVKLERLDLWLPPYHANCRTTTVATKESVKLERAYELDVEKEMLAEVMK